MILGKVKLMEHRINPRLPIEFNVSLNYRSLGIITAKVINISPDGAFVSTRAVKISKHQMLEMVFNFPGVASNEVYKLAAMVVHEAQDGMGLMFVDAHNRLSSLFNKIRS